MDDKEQLSKTSSSLSRKNLDQANLQFIESLVDKNVKVAAGGNLKRVKQEKTAKAEPKKIEPEKPKAKKAKSSSEMNVSDLEYINEENIKSHSSRSRRNRFIIILLILLLLFTIGGFAIYFLLTTQKNNVFLYAHGDGNVAFELDGSELNKFKTPSDMRGFAVFNFTKKSSTEATKGQRYLKLNIKSSGTYSVKFKIDVYQDDIKLSNVRIFERGEYFNDQDGEYCSSKYYIAGGKTIDLCLGFAMEDPEYRDTLNTDNCKIEVHVYLTKVS